MKTCPHRGNMKVLIALVCSLTTMAHGSLEPVGYRPPGTYTQMTYLPPSSSNRHPDNRYVPSSSFDYTSQDVGKLANELSGVLSLPSRSEPAPFSHYLPANRQTFGENDYRVTDIEQGNKIARYQSTSGIRHSFTQARPLGDYLPPKEDSIYRQVQDLPGRSLPRPDKSYLASNQNSGLFSGNDVSTSIGNSINRQGAIDLNGNDRYPSGYESRHSSSNVGGYRYQSPENQTPAKYDFEYEVKDNYGNDYGHKETRNGENTQGVYKVLLPDGRRQIVHYEADSHGYRPTITFEDTDALSLLRRKSSGSNAQGYRY